MTQLERDRAERFFDGYGDALTRNNLEAIARCYAYPSIVITDTASRAITSPDQVMDAFRDDEGTGDAVQAVATVGSIESISSNVAWVTVSWSYRDDFDEEQRSDAYRYLLRNLDSAVEICTVTPVPVEVAR
jgi:hypothetical protein